MKRDRDLKTALVESAGKLQTAHILFRDAGREDICQLLREAVNKVGIAINLNEHLPREEVLS